jgi:hypothetical protein
MFYKIFHVTFFLHLGIQINMSAGLSFGVPNLLYLYSS